MRYYQDLSFKEIAEATGVSINTSLGKENTNNGERKIKIIHVNNMQEAVLKAKENAKSGDIVLLSPASASFDLYKNFAERGKVFKEFVSKI